MPTRERTQPKRPDRRRVLAAAAGLAAAGWASSSVRAQDAVPQTVLITGSNRGIGFAFARKYAALGWRVIATCRAPTEAAGLQELAAANDRVVVEELDVLEHDMIDELAKRYQGTPIDLLINNAGIMGPEPSQIFGTLRFDDFDAVMRTNAVGPLKMAEAFIDHVSASRERKIMTLSSRGGSMTHALGRARYFYRASKSAVNNFMANLAKDVASRGVIVGLLSPGLVANDAMNAEMARTGVALPAMSADESVESLVGIITAFTLEKTGAFFRYNGEIEPW